MMTVLLLIALGLVVSACAFIRQPKFGKLPDGARLERIQSSPNYADGQFQNLIHTPQTTGDSSFIGMLLDYLFVPKERQKPSTPLPSVKTDLHSLDKQRDLVVWLGHSSLYMQLGGKRILIDPVFSDHASPFFFSTRAFAGTSLYTTDDIPEIDYLIISHDHWDHLDYPTVTALKPRIKNVLCGLGVGAHFEYWGFEVDSIHEEDWFSTLKLEKGIAIHIFPARHFSGRWLSRNKALWISCVLETPERRVFYSGDSGYGPHMAEIASRFDGFDLTIMDCGQYDKSWQYIHMMPEEVAQAADELHAQALLPVHAGKFVIANHAWNDPFKRIAAASQDKSYRLLTPMIGQVVFLDDLETGDPKFPPWWDGIE